MIFSFFKKSIKVLDKKSNNNSELDKIGITLNSDLPIINFDESIKLKSIKLKSINEISSRVYILYLLSMVANNEVDGTEALVFLNRFSIFFHLTPKEIDFLENPTNDLKSEYTWKIERVWVLLWVLKKVERIKLPNEFCNTLIINNVFFEDKNLIRPNKFVKESRIIRSKSEIIDKVDLYLKINWKCIEANLNGKILNDVNQKIVYERLYALQWLMNYIGMKWDEMG